MNMQPPDRDDEPEDDKWDRWFTEQEKNGYAVLSRDEWRSRLDETARDGYAEGRSDQRADDIRLLAWAYRKLMPYSFARQEDALAMDEIKLMLECAG